MKSFMDTFSTRLRAGLDLGVSLQEKAVEIPLAFLEVLGVPKDKLESIRDANREMMQKVTAPYKEAVDHSA